MLRVTVESMPDSVIGQPVMVKMICIAEESVLGKEASRLISSYGVYVDREPGKRAGDRPDATVVCPRAVTSTEAVELVKRVFQEGLTKVGAEGEGR